LTLLLTTCKVCLVRKNATKGNEMTNRQVAKANRLLTANPDLGQRDMRDLLMEYGFDGATAGKLTEGR
jgi:hypothetical protein